MNVVYEPDGNVEIRLSVSKPGDHIDIRADMDILAAFSNYPSEHNPCTGGTPHHCAYSPILPVDPQPWQPTC
ncbi:MAG: DUF1989 domain-containing protein [Propionibacteriales bacterium]|nr:DUF1989 domain-containing protein [Propionibacteriales bacterium]